MGLALVMRPWILRLRQTGAVPRLLADDFHVWAEPDHERSEEEVLTDSLQATLVYLHEVGGRPQPAKSLITASTPVVRKSLG
eukprot:7917782-Alexandrium_andersonii.AAC.1